MIDKSERDGGHDFDWEFGTWATHVRVLHSPLSADATWVEYEGTSLVRPLSGGRANVVELDVANASGRIQGLSLRLYNVAGRQWSLNFAGLDGVLTPPTIGSFVDGRGEFYGMETLRERAVLVRFLILDVTEDSARFEQSYSPDGGQTWELNWVANDTRIAPSDPAAL